MIVLVHDHRNGRPIFKYDVDVDKEICYIQHVFAYCNKCVTGSKYAEFLDKFKKAICKLDADEMTSDFNRWINHNFAGYEDKLAKAKVWIEMLEQF